jgi:1,2-diacylglycerol-3-alpha-glucose alpha-1,2-galactosyltransferase
MMKNSNFMILYARRFYAKQEDDCMTPKKNDGLKTINMLSSAYKVKGQGVGSAYEEQVALVKAGLSDEFVISENKIMRADITHYHTVDVKFYLTMGFVKLKGKTVGYVHFLPETVETSIQLPQFMKRVFYAYLLSFYRRMDYLVTVNSYFIDELVRYGVKREKITFIPNFVSDKVFYRKCDDERKKLRQKYNIPEDKFVVLGVGQLQVRKGIFDFLEVSKRLPEIQFVWAGGFSFGNMTDGYYEVKKVMQHPPANVTFLGIIDREKMPEIYNIADIMFLPSFEELFPMTVLESMSCHVPMLLRDIDIYKDILFDFYLREKDVDSFVDTIKRLATDSEYYQAASKASTRGHEYYSKEHVFSMWDEFYRKVYASKEKMSGK